MTKKSLSEYTQPRRRQRAALEQLRTRPGFKDYPDGFYIHRQRVDAAGWDEGFIRAWGDEEPETD